MSIRKDYRRCSLCGKIVKLDEFMYDFELWSDPEGTHVTDVFACEECIQELVEEKFYEVNEERDFAREDRYADFLVDLERDERYRK